MKQINTVRALFGGLVAAVIIDLIEGVIHGVVLKSDWAEAMQALGRSGEVTGYAIALYNICGLLEGIIGVWLYAALTSRYGTGSTTAGKAGLVLWALVSVIPNLLMMPSGLIPSRLVVFSVVIDFIALLLGITMGAILYREDDSPAVRSARA